MQAAAKAFLFDLNGTMVNDMPYHIEAWHQEIIKLGGHLSLEEMKHQCYGKNDELLESIFPGQFSMEEKVKLGNDKDNKKSIINKNPLIYIALSIISLRFLNFSNIKH